jgi:MarR family transcriptional regulator, lower aerobic nicotinate degradation pathway regulator
LSRPSCQHIRSDLGPNKRIKLLRLSLAGSKVLVGMEPVVRRVQERLLEPLDPGERIKMMHMLAQLIRLHEDASPDAAEKNPDSGARPG